MAASSRSWAPTIRCCRASHAQRITLDKERIAHWLKVGAQPSDRVAKFLSQAELMKPRERREQTKKPQPRAKAQERMKADSRRRCRGAGGRGCAEQATASAAR